MRRFEPIALCLGLLLQLLEQRMDAWIEARL